MVINICPSTFPSARLDSRTLGLEWEVGLPAWLLDGFLPISKTYGFLEAFSQVDGFGFRGSLEELELLLGREP